MNKEFVEKLATTIANSINNIKYVELKEIDRLDLIRIIKNVINECWEEYLEEKRN